MTYKNEFVVEVKCKGKILRMRDDFVFLPFGSEYSIYLKNLSSRKASVNIHIDGQDVLDCNSLILEPNTSTELEGFLNGIVARNKFKFIQKTKEIQNHRGDKIDDGIIRVEFAYEQPKPIKKVILEDHQYIYHNHYYWNYDNWFTGDSISKYGTARGLDENVMKDSSVEPIQTYASTVTMDSLGVSSTSASSLNQPLLDEGITVKGKEINQQFQYGSIGILDPSDIIIIRMKGIKDDSNNIIQEPLTVKTKLICSSCGKTYKSSFKYCSNCGTYLE